MPLRVLLVDDDARFRATAARTLVADGVDVVAEVDNGLDVVGAAARWRPDVVLLDIDLPDIDGLNDSGSPSRPPRWPLTTSG